MLSAAAPAEKSSLDLGSAGRIYRLGAMQS